MNGSLKKRLPAVYIILTMKVATKNAARAVNRDFLLFDWHSFLFQLPISGKNKKALLNPERPYYQI